MIIMEPVLVIMIGILAPHGDAKNATVEWKNGDTCTNECDDNDPSYWCGRKRMDNEGIISKCVQYTKKGSLCLTSCQNQKGETYKWCMTNPSRGSNRNLWETCSEEGFTVNQEKCVDSCAKKGRKGRTRNFYWCNTQHSWDYCSPPATVKPVQMTIKGGLCKSQCLQRNQEYYSCTRSFSCKRQGTSCTNYWEYCSVDHMHTRLGHRCKEKCATHGYPYYWCDIEDGSWDYCSPSAEAGVNLSLKEELTIRGRLCKTYCGTQGYSYSWCKHDTDRSGDSWDYCSRQNHTINDEPCLDLCGRRGQSYFWCHTQSSWDYCSPNKDTVNQAVSQECGYLIFIILALWFIEAILH